MQADQVMFIEPKDSDASRQYLAAIVISISTFCYGICVGWVSPSLEYLHSETSPTGSPLTDSELSSVASVFCIGGLFGTYLFGYLAKKLGRRRSGLLVGIPYVACWILKLLVANVNGLLAARILAGLGGAGGLLIGPLYCLEIGNIHVRGALGSIAVLAINAGILFAYTVGAFLPYDTVLWIHLTLPIVYMITFFFMPETPPTLVRMKKYDEAAQTIAWLRNIPIDDPTTKAVLNNLKLEIELANRKKGDNSGTRELGLINVQDVTEIINIPEWKIFIKSKATWKAFIICFIMITIQVYVGVFAVLNFASDIFVDAGSILSPDISAIILSVLQLIGSYISILLMERLGRKILFTVTASILAITLAVLGTYFYLKSLGNDLSSVGWIPVIALSIGICADAIGVGTVPYVIINEVFMLQVREIAVTIIVSWVWVTEFIQTEFYSAAVEAIGSYGVFWVFSSIGFLGTIFCMLCIPETKGKSLDEILRHFDKNLPKKMTINTISENLGS